MYDYFAIVPPGLEKIAEEELQRLSAHETKVEYGGVAFQGSTETMFRIHLRARTITRVLLRLKTFKAFSFPELFNKLGRIHWHQYLAKDATVNVCASTDKSTLQHTGRVEQVVCDALDRPLTSLDAQQTIYVRIEHDVCQISLDCSGRRLDQRGYRLQAVKAPLRESIAAALIHWGDWKPTQSLIVPGCGSGTIAIEAAQIAQKMGAGLQHEFPFIHWTSFKEKRWLKIKTTVEKMFQADVEVSIEASDVAPQALAISKNNAKRAGVTDIIQWQRMNMLEMHPKKDAKNGLIICNPPYNHRIPADTSALYAGLGRACREHFEGWTVIVLCPDTKTTRSLGMPIKDTLTFLSGGKKVVAVKL
ncbi:MAG: methyltransferase [Mariprofundaceae bacterium]|nr:methyltransferase [Mariprofundaceae bacterium]